MRSRGTATLQPARPERQQAGCASRHSPDTSEASGVMLYVTDFELDSSGTRSFSSACAPGGHGEAAHQQGWAKYKGPHPAVSALQGWVA